MLPKSLEKKLKTHFPNAQSGKSLSSAYLYELEQLGISLSKVLYATSLCSDDANIASMEFSDKLLGPFRLGGLAGLPMTGITGMKAFASHIPDAGTAFIFYGPHIGIDDDGRMGFMRRPGQAESTESCGALKFTYDLIAKGDTDFELDSDDSQLGILKFFLSDYKDKILESKKDHVINITEAALDCTDRLLKKYIVEAKDLFVDKRIILLGGIIINTSPEIDDLVEVRNFEEFEIK